MKRFDGSTPDDTARTTTARVGRRSTRAALALAALSAVLLVAPVLHAADAPPDDAPWAERFRWSGEELYYSIEMLGSEAVRAAVGIGPPVEVEEWGRVVPLEGLAQSVGFFANVYSMEDTALTYVNPESGLPVFTSKVIDERGSRRVYDVAFGGDTYRASVVRTAERAQNQSRLTPSSTHDAISWMIDLRSRDLSVGRAYVYHVFDGWKLSRLTGRISGHTELETPIGTLEVAEIRFTREVLSSYPALPWLESARVPPVYGLVSPPEELGVGWFSLDERRLPVGVSIETPIGHIRMILDRHVPPTEAGI